MSENARVQSLKEVEQKIQFYSDLVFEEVEKLSSLWHLLHSFEEEHQYLLHATKASEGGNGE